MRVTKFSLEQFVFFAAISGHLIAEVIRRFIWYSPLVYLFADVILIGSAIFLIAHNGIRVQLISLVLICLYVFFGVLSLGIEGGSILLLIPGLRPLILALAMYAVNNIYFRKFDDAENSMLNILGLTTLFILLIAILQLFAGVDASINQLPAESDSEGGGRGDYGAAGVYVENIFRPTSIFMHTGRLGQYSFVAALLPLMIVFSNKSSRRALFFTVIGLLLVVISGQRAAALFISFGALFVAVRAKQTFLIFRLLLIVLILLFFSFLVDENIRQLLFGRLISGLFDASERILENSNSSSEVLSQFFFHGKGIGFFSFGGNAFGGGIFYDYMRKFEAGNLENGWFRILGESGFGGLFSFFAMLLIFLRRTMFRLKHTNVMDGLALHYSALIMIVALSVWSLTHDVFANYLILIHLFMFLGASDGKWLRKRAV